MIEKLVSDRFLKNSDWAYLWTNSLSFYTFCFSGMSSWGLLKHIDTKLRIIFFYLTLSFFKNKKSAGTILPASFSA